MNLNEWRKTEDPDLVLAITNEIEIHVNSLRSQSIEFYGYAALPGDYCTGIGPPRLGVAYNREADIDSANIDDRYSVDEWDNWIGDGFERTNSILEAIYNHFKVNHERSPAGFNIDDQEIAFIAKIHRAILNSFRKLKEEGLFSDEHFLIIWISDSGHEIMQQSAQALNTPEIYEKYASKFL